MGKPRLLDLFAGSGGAAFGYYLAGFSVFGVDNDPKPLRHYPFPHVCGDALEVLGKLLNGEGITFSNGETLYLRDFAAFHCSPPCQGYSIMHNLPWLKGREYPLLILPTLELLETTGRPYVLENVMGARYGAKGLKKRGLEAHGLKAGWLCGGMFGLPFYRHRLFATNWFWLAPGHPKHRGVIRRGPLFGNNGGRLQQVVFSEAEDARGKASWPNRRGGESGSGLSLRAYTRKDGKVEVVTKTGTTEPGYGLSQWQNGAQAEGVGIGHAKGWKLAAEAMGIDWMNRAELTQAIPPAYTAWLGEQLMKVVLAPGMCPGVEPEAKSLQDALAPKPLAIHVTIGVNNSEEVPHGGRVRQVTGGRGVGPDTRPHGWDTGNG